jgi:hypothetical protein
VESCQDQAIPNEDSSSTHVEPPSSTHDEHSSQDEASNQEQVSSPQSNEQDQGEEQVLPHSNDQAQVDSSAIGEAQTEFIGYDGQPRQVRASTRQSSLVVDNVLGGLSRGVITRRQLHNFVTIHAFVSFLEPLKVVEALGDPVWIEAMNDELHSFEQNKVWSLVERPKDHKINVIGTKWIFKNKQDENGIIVCNKARLVAQVTHKSKVWTMRTPLHRLPVLKLFVFYLLMHRFMISNFIKWT